MGVERGVVDDRAAVQFNFFSFGRASVGGGGNVVRWLGMFGCSGIKSIRARAKSDSYSYSSPPSR